MSSALPGTCQEVGGLGAGAERLEAFICLEFSIIPSYLDAVTPWYGSPGTNKIKKSGL